MGGGASEGCWYWCFLSFELGYQNRKSEKKGGGGALSFNVIIEYPLKWRTTSVQFSLTSWHFTFRFQKYDNLDIVLRNALLWLRSTLRKVNFDRFSWILPIRGTFKY